MSEIKRYNTTMVILHWALAIVIAGAIFLGAFVLDEMKSDHPQKIILLKPHILAGAGILILTAFRLYVRFTTQQPAPVAGDKPVMDKIAKGIHHLLYVLTILTALAGIALAVAADLPAVLLSHAAALPKSYEDFAAHEAHGLFANLLFFTILLHAAAALYHQFVLKDGLLARMSLRKE
jgi:cytochrome b561